MNDRMAETSYSGTSGYIVRNLSHLRHHETPAERAAAFDMAPPKHREPDEGILEHERMRKVEVRCLELQVELEDKGYGFDCSQHCFPLIEFIQNGGRIDRDRSGRFTKAIVGKSGNT